MPKLPWKKKITTEMVAQRYQEYNVNKNLLTENSEDIVARNGKLHAAAKFILKNIDKLSPENKTPFLNDEKERMRRLIPDVEKGEQETVTKAQSDLAIEEAGLIRADVLLHKIQLWIALPASVKKTAVKIGSPVLTATTVDAQKPSIGKEGVKSSDEASATSRVNPPRERPQRPPRPAAARPLQYVKLPPEPPAESSTQYGSLQQVESGKKGLPGIKQNIEAIEQQIRQLANQTTTPEAKSNLRDAIKDKIFHTQDDLSSFKPSTEQDVQELKSCNERIGKARADFYKLGGDLSSKGPSFRR